MSNFLTSLSNLMRSVASLAVVTLVGIGGWLGYTTINDRQILNEELQQKVALIEKQNKDIERLNVDVAEKAKKIAELDLAMRLLKVDHRIAEMTVVNQGVNEKNGKLETTVQLAEVDDNGKQLAPPKTYLIDGDVVFIDGLIVKYQDKLIEAGDPLRGTSAFLFRRIYGEHQEPGHGFPIDPVDGQPAPYGGETKMSDIDKTVWTNFWDIANDPERRDAAGIRAAHGEAKYMKVQPGKVYRVQLRASDGVTIVAEKRPTTTQPIQ